MDRFIISSINFIVMAVIVITMARGVNIVDVSLGDGFIGFFFKFMLPILFINYLVKQIDKKSNVEKLFFIKIHRRLVTWTGLLCLVVLAYTLLLLKTSEGFPVRIADLAITPGVVWFLVSSNHHVMKLRRQF